jgi:hypothetical protein
MICPRPFAVHEQSPDFWYFLARKLKANGAILTTNQLISAVFVQTEYLNPFHSFYFTFCFGSHPNNFAFAPANLSDEKTNQSWKLEFRVDEFKTGLVEDFWVARFLFMLRPFRTL